MSLTPNVGLQTPAIGSNNWGGPLNYNFSQLDLFLAGLRPIVGLNVQGNVTVSGTITAGSFAGLDGVFLTSNLYNQPYGIPQLNAGGLIPASLLSNQGIVTVPFAPTPVFNAANGSQFKITLTGDVTSSTFSNGGQGGNLVTFRIVQDANGNRAWVWPANVRNGGQVAPGAGTRNVQVFALDTDGSLDAVGPMMTS